MAVHPVICGDRALDVRFPEETRVIRPNPPRPALAAPEAAIAAALDDPIGMPALGSLAGPGARVTIAFDDRALPPTVPDDFRALAIPLILDRLMKAGVALEDVRLLCANALHRRWTRGELATILGPMIPALWGPDRLRCHDAENAEELAHLGKSERGLDVEVSRFLLESDLTVYVNVTLSPMNGGWKSTVVGLSSFRSIRGHHRPFPFSSGKSIMDPKRSSFQKILGEMGGVLRAEMDRRGARLFQLEATVNNSLPSEIIAVHGGEVEAVHARTLAAMSEQVIVDVDGQTDVMVIGLPNVDPYSQLSRINPLLVVNLGCAYTFGLYEVAPAVREGGVLILANPFQHQFSAVHHPSYIEFFETLLRRTRDPFELWDAYVDDFARRPEYLHAYRHGYAFHGAHPFFMWNSTVTPRRHCAAIFAAGVEDRRVTERLGLPSFWTVEDAVAAAGALLGKTKPTVTFLPIPPLSVTRLRGA